MYRGFATTILVVIPYFGLAACPDASAQTTLVGDPFVSPSTGWVDAFPPPVRAGNWRLSLHNPTLMDTNNANPPTSGAVNNSGTYEPDVLIQNNFAAPGTYDLTATLRTNDDDIIGLVWNYLDPNNYFRVGIRTQAAGTFGGTQGVAVQKIVGGVVTQISPAGTGVGAATPITQAMINNRTAFDLKVAVDGTNYQIQFNGTPIISGTDPNLVSGRKVGVQSWAQLSDTDETPDPPFWGTEVQAVAVTQGASTLFSQNFAARPVQFRQVVMTNALGVATTATSSLGDIGNFGVAVNKPWVFENSNGFENATASAPNVDFIGPAVVVDEPGSASLTDYDMRVRLGAADDDGIGVLLRVQDDDTFYRVNFAAEAIGVGAARAPRGLSVQKVRDGVWSELFRDDQVSPLFVPAVGTAGQTPDSGLPLFDLSVRAIGNQLMIQVIQDPDGAATVINYPLITDATNPLLSGTVGLTTWGNDNSYFTSYGGESGPLLTMIPEPTSAALLLSAGAPVILRRRGAARQFLPR